MRKIFRTEPCWNYIEKQQQEVVPLPNKNSANPPCIQSLLQLNIRKEGERKITDNIHRWHTRFPSKGKNTLTKATRAAPNKNRTPKR
uniref:Uncharacterized protein n=1 Tax=Arion vulgaris TaxID=1028688 RepID=A0A0B6Y1I2_9EUPU